MPLRALFLTWDGPQQSYLESLFFPIFAGLKAYGVDVHTLQLTWAVDQQLEVVHSAAQRFGTTYSSRRIPERARKLALPAAVLYGAGAALRYATSCHIETLFPRSLIPMSMALLARQVRPSLELVFDADGFMADERVDFGGWDAGGIPYRALRRVEAQGFSRARAVICRTEAAKRILLDRAAEESQDARAKVFVAPNGKDSSLFAPGTTAERVATRAKYAIQSGVPWVVYVGSIGPQYLPELMLDAFAEILSLSPEAHLSCFTLHGTALLSLVDRRGLPSGSVSVLAAAPAEIPAILAAADLGFALRKECFSQRGVCPIKVSEYLLCGVPVVASRVGDLPSQLAGEAAALLIDPEAPQAAQDIAEWFVSSVMPDRERLRLEARSLGLKWFELARCVETYARMLYHPQRPPAP